MKPKVIWMLVVVVSLVCVGLLYAQSRNEPSDWAKEAWEWATDQGIIDGADPQGTCTREMVITWLYKLEQHRAGRTLDALLVEPASLAQRREMESSTMVMLSELRTAVDEFECDVGVYPSA